MINKLVENSKPGEKGGISIQINTDDGNTSPSREQTFVVEAGTRDGKLAGCQIWEHQKPVESAVCSLDKGRLRIEIGQTSTKLVFDLGKTPDGKIAGESFMQNNLIPMGKIKVGDVSMTALDPAIPTVTPSSR